LQAIVVRAFQESLSCDAPIMPVEVGRGKPLQKDVDFGQAIQESLMLGKQFFLIHIHNAGTSTVANAKLNKGFFWITSMRS